MSLKSLKARRGTSAITKMTEAAAKLEKKGYEPDPRLWKAPRDKDGNGYAVIRFLPAPEQNELPWGRYWSHAFKGERTGQWYIERSLTSLGKQDPLGELNSKDYNSGSEARKALASKRKRKLNYVANIYVVSDPARPENEGKVFMYEFGKKIYNKIMEAMQPEYPDEAPMDPFDMWEGGNFKLKVRKVEGFPNYDKSDFDDPSALLDGDDAELEAVYEQVHDLDKYTLEEGYKTYDQLKARLDMVMGSVSEEVQRDLNTTAESAPIPSVEESQPATSVIDTGDDEDLSVDAEDDGDVSSYFDSLADED